MNELIGTNPGVSRNLGNSSKVNILGLHLIVLAILKNISLVSFLEQACFNQSISSLKSSISSSDSSVEVTFVEFFEMRDELFSDLLIVLNRNAKNPLLFTGL